MKYKAILATLKLCWGNQLVVDVETLLSEAVGETLSSEAVKMHNISSWSRKINHWSIKKKHYHTTMFCSNMISKILLFLALFHIAGKYQFLRNFYTSLMSAMQDEYNTVGHLRVSKSIEDYNKEEHLDVNQNMHHKCPPSKCKV